MSRNYSKYGNRKVRVGDMVFDSKHEYDRWMSLQVLEANGEIEQLKRQVSFELIPAQYETFSRFGKTGKPLKDGQRCVEKSVSYVADFTYLTKDGQFVVEDAKGVRTPEYIIKRKLMLWVHKIRVKEV